jgi:hypothetical protein
MFSGGVLLSYNTVYEMCYVAQLTHRWALYTGIQKFDINTVIF